MADVGAWICDVGMVTPVGGCTAQTAASVRAGISRYRESPVYNKHFEPMILALVPDDDLPPLADSLVAAPGLTARQARMLRLAQPAIEEALQALPPGPPLPLFLALPEALPGRPPTATEAFLDDLVVQSGAAVDLDQSRIFTTGRAGGFQAMAEAIELLAQGSLDHILVGGVDSYLDLFLLGALDDEDRVLAEGVMDGFAPGEGAAFLVLGSEQARQAIARDKTVFLQLPGVASEPGHRYSDQPYKGEGLAEAVSLALTTNGQGPVQTVFAGLNGENFGAKEWGVAAMRNQPALDPDLRFEHPADCFGDTGAAMAPLLVGLAAVGLRDGTLSGPCLAWSSSEAEHRAAACMTLT